MSDMADFANEYQCDSLEDLLDYQTGRMSEEEAYDCGLLDEYGFLGTNTPYLWGVHDVESLTQELNNYELKITHIMILDPDTKLKVN